MGAPRADDGRARVQTSLRLAPDVLDRLQTAADERGIGRNLLIEWLLADGLDRLIPVDELVLTRSTS
jgi:hypothetical protein